MGPRALVSSQNELGCLDPPHPVSSLAHDRGTTVRDTSPHTCVRPEHPFYGAGVTPFPWFWRECRRIHFGRALLGGVRRANPPRSSRPSSLLRGERARCSESNAAIDESKRALTSSPMRPVQPGGTSTTDSSCPSVHSPRTFEWDRTLATPESGPLQVGHDSANDSFERYHAPDLVTEELP